MSFCKFYRTSQQTQIRKVAIKKLLFGSSFIVNLSGTFRNKKNQTVATEGMSICFQANLRGLGPQRFKFYPLCWRKLWDCAGLILRNSEDIKWKYYNRKTTLAARSNEVTEHMKRSQCEFSSFYLGSLCIKFQSRNVPEFLNLGNNPLSLSRDLIILDSPDQMEPLFKKLLLDTLGENSPGNTGE